MKARLRKALIINDFQSFSILRLLQNKTFHRDPKKTISILVFIRKAKLLRNGEAPICAQVTVNKQSVSADKWCQTKECAKGTQPMSIYPNS